MKPVNLVILWHMHQPQYRDPANGEYILPWTRLHALKDYWGMVHLLEEFPGVHATFNIVPGLALQLEEYASGHFKDSWFTSAFTPAEKLTQAQKAEILLRAFQANHEHMIGRWQRFRALHGEVQRAGSDAAQSRFTLRDWRDLQVLSQLAWMDEEYLALDPVVAELSRKGEDFTEDEKQALAERQGRLLADVLPEYRRAQDRGQIEISTTPFYHPILPLVCDTDIAREANPWTPLPKPPFQHPRDARTHLERARAYHERLFGQPPRGLWPSEGSVSNQALEIAMDLGFSWCATDEGVLGRTRNIGFARDAAGMPEHAVELYSPWTLDRNGGRLSVLFRDHYLSDLVGFVYSRMSADAAANDLHHRIRQIGERWSESYSPTVCLILDGENAWEYYPENGREFLRQFYERMEDDSDIRALTASEAIAEAGSARTLDSIFPASWINANFDIWIGHQEDVRAWELLGEARRVYGEAAARHAAGESGARSAEELDRAFESILAAEGSDWCWWYGPENSSANDADFDAIFRKHLTGVYLALGQAPPDVLGQPVAITAAPARSVPPDGLLNVTIDGRETTFFEWLGAGTYFPELRSGAMHGRTWLLGGLHFGFSRDAFFLRVDPVGESFARLRDAEFRIIVHAKNEVRATLEIKEGRLAAYRAHGQGDDVSFGEEPRISAALGKIIEVRLERSLFVLAGCDRLRLAISIWQGGLPMDFLPAEGQLEIVLGADAFAWSVVNGR
jgi:alpha-amylase/alpha-mannosidase (GH57 family)